MIQLATQLAAALSWWGRGQIGRGYLLASVVLKALVVGIVSMQRLDDKYLVRLSRPVRSTCITHGLADAHGSHLLGLIRSVLHVRHSLLDIRRGFWRILVQIEAELSMCKGSYGV